MGKILVIGGGVYQTALIKRICELGHKAYCVDKNPKAPGFRISTEYRCVDTSDFDTCLSYARELDIDGVGTYGATITLPTVSYIGEKLNLPTLNSFAAKIAGNKYQIKKVLVEYGCNNKGRLNVFHSVEEALAHDIVFPCAVKPSDGSGSKGVSIVRNADYYEQAVRFGFAAARFNEVYVEGAIDGEEYSVEAFVNDEEVYIYSIIKTTFEKNGVRNSDISYGHTTPADINTFHEQLIKNEVIKAIRALKINMGSVNIDVILSVEDSKVYIIDCGIRIGQNLIASHMIPLSRGVNELDMYISQLLGKTVDPEPKFKKYISTRLLIPEPGTIKEIKPMDEYIGKYDIVDIVLRKHAGELQRVYTDKSDNVGWVICCGESSAMAEKRAEQARMQLLQNIIIE